MKQTPLTSKHHQLGAKMVDFAGFEMPIQYKGVLEEHRTVRSAVGIFDLCHMGEFELKGPDALGTLDKVTSNDPKLLKQGEIQYTCLTNEKGGIIDDILVYRAADSYILVVNASNTAKDYAWLKKQLLPGAQLEDLTAKTALIAVQGPKSADLAEEILDLPLHELKNYTFIEPTYSGEKILLSRTGYTGEDGFEMYVSNALAPHLWDVLMAEGEKYGIAPIGLGARDTLRLEARLPLYGNDLNEEITPLEAGLSRFVKLKKGDFIGRKALLTQKERGLEKKLVAFIMRERGIPRQGYLLNDEDGKEIGYVTSGTHSPSLNQAIGMGYVRPEQSKPGTLLEVIIRKKSLRAEVIKGRFLGLKK